MELMNRNSENFLAGYFGLNKTLELVAWQYY